MTGVPVIATDVGAGLPAIGNASRYESATSRMRRRDSRRTIGHTQRAEMDITTLEKKDQIAEERPDCYLFVDQSGEIVGDSIMKAEHEQHETWSFQYRTPRVRLQRLYPTVDEPRSLMLDLTSDV